MVSPCKDLIKAVSVPMHAEQWRLALQIFESGMKTLPEAELHRNYFEAMYIHAKLLAMCSRFEDSFGVLRDLVDRGMPCGSWAFERLPFREQDRVVRLSAESDRLCAKLQQESRMTFEVRLPEGGVPAERYPLFMALHGDGTNCNIREFSMEWAPGAFVKGGYLLVYVQSSQVRCYDGYGWLPEPLAARKDIATCYNEVCAEYPVDPERVFVGGYSGGAIAALDITLSGTLPVKGFLALCPELKPASFTVENVASAARRGVRGVFMEGSLVMPVPEEETMAHMFQEAGLSLLRMVNEGYGHEIPDDFAAKALSGLRFIDL